MTLKYLGNKRGSFSAMGNFEGRSEYLDPGICAADRPALCALPAAGSQPGSARRRPAAPASLSALTPCFPLPASPCTPQSPGPHSDPHSSCLRCRPVREGCLATCVCLSASSAGPRSRRTPPRCRRLSASPLAPSRPWRVGVVSAFGKTAS